MKKLLSLLLLAAAVLFVAQPAEASKSLHTRMDTAEKVYVGVALNVSETTQVYAISPVNGDVKNIWCANKDTTVVGTTTITPKVNAVATTTLSVSGTAVGTVVSTAVSSSNTIDTGETIELESNGGASSGGVFECMIEIVPDYTE